MTKSSEEIFNDKVSLIYEYNKKSPLFARMANTEIENNNVERAIEILNEGLKQYPDYSAAHLLLGKAYTLIGNYSHALKSIKTGSNLIHSKKTYEHYLREIEIMKKQRALFQTTRRSAFLGEEDYSEINEPDLFEEKETPDIKEIKMPQTKSSIEERLEQIAREISSAKIPEVPKDTVTPMYNLDSYAGESMIVSETLAKIYIAQGEYLEAITVYEKLKKKNPDQTDYYNQQIEILNKEIE